MHKNTKVYFMGKRVFFGNQHVAASKFQLFMMKVRDFLHRVFQWMKLGAVMFAVMAICFMIGRSTHTEKIFADSTSDLSVKVDQLKDGVVNDIAIAENKTNVPVIPDDNKAHSLPLKDKVSIGCMQFKISTIQHYYSVLKKGSISDTDAVILGLDCTKAKALAKEVIFDTQGGLWNWSVATKEMGSKVEIIKQLEK